MIRRTLGGNTGDVVSMDDFGKSFEERRNFAIGHYKQFIYHELLSEFAIINQKKGNTTVVLTDTTELLSQSILKMISLNKMKLQGTVQEQVTAYINALKIQIRANLPRFDGKQYVNQFLVFNINFILNMSEEQVKEMIGKLNNEGLLSERNKIREQFAEFFQWSLIYKKGLQEVNIDGNSAYVKKIQGFLDKRTVLSDNSKAFILFLAKRYVIAMNQMMKLLSGYIELLIEHALKITRELFALGPEDTIKLVIRFFSRTDEEAEENEKKIGNSIDLLKNWVLEIVRGGVANIPAVDVANLSSFISEENVNAKDKEKITNSFKNAQKLPNIQIA